MSELDDRHHLNNEFADFEAVYMEPVLTENFRKIREYNELLASQAVNYDEISEIIHDLDSNWLALIGSEAEFNGFAWFLDENETGFSGEPVRDYYENQTVIFRGATAVPIEGHHLIQDAIENREHEHRYRLVIGMIREGIDSNAEYVQMLGSTDVDDVVSLELNNAMSIERARSIVSYYFPEIIEDIDVEILNEADDECERIMKLAGYEWSLDDARTQGDENLIPNIKKALQVYISSLFDFDSYVGYGIEAEGEAWLLRGDTYTPIDFTAVAIATVVSVTWEDAPRDEASTIRAHLKVLLHDEDKDDPPITLMIPLISITDLYSIRRSFHEAANESQQVEEK